MWSGRPEQGLSALKSLVWTESAPGVWSTERGVDVPSGGHWTGALVSGDRLLSMDVWEVEESSPSPLDPGGELTVLPTLLRARMGGRVLPAAQHPMDRWARIVPAEGTASVDLDGAWTGMPDVDIQVSEPFPVGGDELARLDAALPEGGAGAAGWLAMGPVRRVLRGVSEARRAEGARVSQVVLTVSTRASSRRLPGAGELAHETLLATGPVTDPRAWASYDEGRHGDGALLGCASRTFWEHGAVPGMERLERGPGARPADVDLGIVVRGARAAGVARVELISARSGSRVRPGAVLSPDTLEWLGQGTSEAVAAMPVAEVLAEPGTLEVIPYRPRAWPWDRERLDALRLPPPVDWSTVPVGPSPVAVQAILPLRLGAGARWDDHGQLVIRDGVVQLLLRITEVPGTGTGGTSLGRGAQTASRLWGATLLRWLGGGALLTALVGLVLPARPRAFLSGLAQLVRFGGGPEGELAAWRADSARLLASARRALARDDLSEEDRTFISSAVDLLAGLATADASPTPGVTRLQDGVARRLALTPPRGTRERMALLEGREAPPASPLGRSPTGWVHIPPRETEPDPIRRGREVLASLRLPEDEG